MSAPSGAFYVIEIGGNDLRDALLAAVGGGNPAAILSAAVESLNDNILRLYAAGARDFLVWRAPDIGLTPAIASIPGGSAAAGQLTVLFNAGVDALLGQLGAALPGVRFLRLDAYAKLNTVVAKPQLFGLRNVSAAYITPNVPPFACKKPDQYLFWDGIHPTKAGHAILAEEAAQVLAP